MLLNKSEPRDIVDLNNISHTALHINGKLSANTIYGEVTLAQLQTSLSAPLGWFASTRKRLSNTFAKLHSYLFL